MYQFFISGFLKGSLLRFFKDSLWVKLIFHPALSFIVISFKIVQILLLKMQLYNNTNFSSILKKHNISYKVDFFSFIDSNNN